MRVDDTSPAPGPGVTGPGTTVSGPLFDGKVVRSARSFPISGGTLAIMKDGTTAVAADPDRARVFLADLSTHAVRSIPTLDDDEVGRVVEGEPGRAYVVARRGGAILAIDIATATIAQRFPVCNAPRGIAYEAAKGQLHVACASGALVTLDPATGAVLRKVTIDDDLRDVVVYGDKLLVSRFRSAQLVMIDNAGRISTRGALDGTGFNNFAGPPSLAYRAIPSSDGTVVVVHQQSVERTLGTGLGAYYGGNCGGSVADTYLSTARAPISGGVTSPSLQITSTALAGAIGPLDVAVSHDARRVAVISTGNSWVIGAARPTLGIINGSPGSTPPGGCWDQAGINLEGGEAVAVAFDGQNRYVVQYREPAMLHLETNELVKNILLSSDSHADTGLALFHVNPGGGVACASCHAEGGVDGHVWHFSAGSRVTQPLEGGLSKRAPFHWSGEFKDWPSLVTEVMMKRMAMPVAPSAEQSKALLDWIDTIPAPKPTDDLAADAIDRGRAVFLDASVGCASCHTGTMFTDNLPHDVGTGGTFISPSLVGVGARSPLIHDGCAATLRDRFVTCGGGDRHGTTSRLTTAQLDDLVTFLRSL
jgi:mono/diheme cytochrome c family protein